jgi:hypothetical protein
MSSHQLAEKSEKQRKHVFNQIMPNQKIPAKHRECNKNIWHTVGTA